MVPVTFTGFDWSYSADSEWWASIGWLTIARLNPTSKQIRKLGVIVELSIALPLTVWKGFGEVNSNISCGKQSGLSSAASLLHFHGPALLTSTSGAAASTVTDSSRDPLSGSRR
jgi:hypothetical protein